MKPSGSSRYQKATCRFLLAACRVPERLLAGQRAGHRMAPRAEMAVLVLALVGVVTGTTHATCIVPATQGFPPFFNCNASTPGLRWKTCRHSFNDGRLVGVERDRFLFNNAETPFEGRRLQGSAVVSYHLPFLVASVGMPPSSRARRAVTSPSSPSSSFAYGVTSGMSAFYQRWVGGGSGATCPALP